jgi:murein DD-endopeptidase MepM/ murein hydrolase activator NlpD
MENALNPAHARQCSITMMKPSHWTFLYVPSSEGGVRTVTLDKRLTAALGVLVAVLVVGMMAITISFVRQSDVLETLDQRDREVATLREKISGLEDAVGHYQQLMAENRELQERASLIAGLGPLEDEFSSALGQGGQEPLVEPGLGLVDEVSRDRIRDLRVQLDRLLQEARFQRDGYEKVLTALRDDQQIRETTPSVRPVIGGYLSSRYGRRIDPFTGQPAFHRGLDFSARVGTPVLAPASGRVKRASRGGSLGLLVELDHGNGLVTRYAHLDEYLVRKGDWVTRGQIIGRVGNTGRSTGPHLHYEVVENGRSQNPWLYIIRD